ncbi:putative membrane protein [Propionispora sp. 2/2-37]|uniref:sensor histidine kinase n=1 Tax=Propionispora sp. 2/2-37 TaxID=1677858 RepID=UPI0006BB6C0E|nr:ATP-binding protein [Propionispora sp. 2/2-37]CUH96250.1 putative membrane protein [Propionispora sp. 2/2-37]
MKKFNSITIRITGLMFLSIAITVFLLIYLADEQMIELFREYLVVQRMETSHGLMGQQNGGVAGVTLVMGPLEETFLASVHTSLIWVGMGIMVVGLAASYTLARSITVPLRKLSHAAEQMEQGNLGQNVPVETSDEVGHLAMIFNRMSQTLAASEKLRRQLLANIAHELRTPLSVIQGHLEGMIDGVIAPDKMQLSSLHEEAVRLNRLIRDLRDLSLAEVRQLALEKMPADINQIIKRTVLMLKPISDDKQIEIICSLTESLPELTVDADRISQVFYNILINGIRYSPPQGRIEIRTYIVEFEGRQWLKASIKDEGPGISPEDLPYVFDHFYRGDKSRDRKSGGSGIGLAIVKQLVGNHGGQVYAENSKAGGSIFHVLLPVAIDFRP